MHDKTPQLEPLATRRLLIRTGLAALAAGCVPSVAAAAATVYGPARAVTPVSPQPAQPFRGQYVGCQVGAFGLGNHPYHTYHAHRFRCEMTGQLARIRWYNVTDNTGGGTGYSSGSGGRIQVQVQADSNGLPSGRVLGETAVLANAASLGNYPLVACESPVTLSEGRRYHIVYRQLAPSEGWVSVNDLYSPTAPAQKCAWPYWEADLASIRHSSGGWRVYEASIPIFELHYTNGVIKGQGYTFGGPSPRIVDGPNQARQLLRPNRTVKVGQVRLRLWRDLTGAGDLTISLNDPSGTLSRVVVPRVAFAASAGDVDGAASIPWVTANLPADVQLIAGGTYYIVLSAPDGAKFRIATSFKGFYEKFADDKILPKDNHAQASTDDGNTWRGWSLWGSSDRTDTDIPLLLTITG